MPRDEGLKGAKNLMGALVRMKPKRHEDMKLGKNKEKPPESPRRKRRQRTAGQ